MNTINTYSDKNINDIFEKTTLNMKEDTTMDTINSYQDKAYTTENAELGTTNTYQDKYYHDICKKTTINTKEVLNDEQ